MKTPGERTTLTRPRPMRSTKCAIRVQAASTSFRWAKLAPRATAFAASPHPSIARRLNAYRRKGNRRLSVEFPDLILKGTIMDKDRINGAADQAKGSIKEAAGKVTGDAKLQTEGTLDKAKRKVESAIGGVKDAVRNAN